MDMRNLVITIWLCAATMATAQTAAPKAAPARPGASAPAAAPKPAPLPANASKPELVARLVQLQQGQAAAVAQSLLNQPLAQIQQQVGQVLQRLPAEQREGVAKDVQAEMRKYAEEVTPILRDALQRLAAQTMAPIYEERFNDDELRQLIAMLESPLVRKFEQTVPEVQKALNEKIIADVRGRMQERLRSLDQAVARRFNAAASAAAAAAAASGADRKP
jgi:hypothetical protein